MIKYTLDSTLTLKAVNVFKNQGLRKSESYKRNNSAEYGYSLNQRAKNKIRKYVSGYFLEKNALKSNLLWVTLTVPPKINKPGNWRFSDIVIDEELLNEAIEQWQKTAMYNPETDDKKIVAQLSKFLENLKKNHGLKDVIWIAERQDGKRNKEAGINKAPTNAIHFHCIFDFKKYVPVQNLNLYWLKLLNEIGYEVLNPDTFRKKANEIFSLRGTWERRQDLFHNDPWIKVTHSKVVRDKIRKQAKKEKEQALELIDKQSFKKAFYGLNAFSINPDCAIAKLVYNPLDLEKVSIKTHKQLSIYLTKYVTKNTSKIYSRAWAASRGFSSVNYEIELSEKEADSVINSKMVKHKYESNFEIENRKYTTEYYYLDFNKFKNSDAYNMLVSSITEQRLNIDKLLDYDSVKNLNLSEQLKIKRRIHGKKELSTRTNNQKIKDLDISKGIDFNKDFESNGIEEPEIRELQIQTTDLKTSWNEFMRKRLKDFDNRNKTQPQKSTNKAIQKRLF